LHRAGAPADVIGFVEQVARANITAEESRLATTKGVARAE
jgi:hypothetical protein